MDLSDGMGEYSTSTKLDLINRRPMEVKYMFRKAVERAQKIGVPVSHLETLVAQIEAYQRHYNLFWLQELPSTIMKWYARESQTLQSTDSSWMVLVVGSSFSNLHGQFIGVDYMAQEDMW